MASQSESDQTRAPLLRSSSASTLGPLSSTSSLRDVFPNPKRRRDVRTLQILSFASAIISSFCVGTVSVFSLYAPRFQQRLRFTQFEINAIASAMSISLYIPVPLVGYLCDRVGPGPLSLVAAVLLAGGYGTAAAVYHKGDVALRTIDTYNSHALVPYMVVAFICVGAGTACMYLTGISTCAKNFGKGKYRGLMLAAPLTSIGLGGILVPQFGSHVLYERLPNGGRGEVNVYHFFIFLSILLATAGLFGGFALRVINENELIDDAVEELERSGFLEGSGILRRSTSSYGALSSSIEDMENAGILDPSKDDEDENNALLKKQWLLNAETRKFLTDHTMWSLAVGFWLIVGPGEAFINNLGTLIGTLYSPGLPGSGTSAATHVSILAATSTAARLLTGSLSDVICPSPHTQHPQTGLTSSGTLPQRRFSVSRIILLVGAGSLLSVGTLILASGIVQGHGDRFWLVSGLVGFGYGALFSLTPIIVTIIWGVENFGTNFGIVAVSPAIGSTMWGLIYSAEYQNGAKNSPLLADGAEDVFCHGKQCYTGTFWAMTVSVWIGCALFLWAWKGRNGWSKRGVVI
ncbi:putative transporter MCH1 [Truncatella angustata]|uniref:Probable transporter MCH1 n=1 Tax=Truncatella angustata TaxID=152316 RepID=A0A9P8UQG9_9PEZI|nr:putative transporter MCH1 [Truncatella angustata]KAH6656378.1 putative transporter MCH1 [Truncatella angustata]